MNKVFKVLNKIENMSKVIQTNGDILFFDTSEKINIYTDKDHKYGKIAELKFSLAGSNDIFTDFLYLHNGVIIFSQKIYDYRYVHNCFYYSGEIIELDILNAPCKYYMSNVTYAINPLDYSKTKFGIEDNFGQKPIMEYHFNTRRLRSDKPLFKMENDWSNTIYTLCEPLGNNEPDFYRTIKSAKITSLIFEEVASY